MSVTHLCGCGHTGGLHEVPDLWLSCSLQRCAEPGTLAQNWMMGQQTAYNEAVELAVAAVQIYSLASASWLGSLVASQW